MVGLWGSDKQTDGFRPGHRVAVSKEGPACVCCLYWPCARVPASPVPDPHATHPPTPHLDERVRLHIHIGGGLICSWGSWGSWAVGAVGAVGAGRAELRLTRSSWTATLLPRPPPPNPPRQARGPSFPSPRPPRAPPLTRPPRALPLARPPAPPGPAATFIAGAACPAAPRRLGPHPTSIITCN